MGNCWDKDEFFMDIYFFIKELMILYIVFVLNDLLCKGVKGFEFKKIIFLFFKD